MINVALGFFILVNVVCFVGMLRNNSVYKYRSWIINRIYDASIGEDGDSMWRHKMFEQVSYNDMVIKFWKPLDSFWEDMSFIDPKAKGPK